MDVALLDLDGVLADDRHRAEYALNKQWDEYFREDRMYADTVWPEGRALYERSIADGKAVQFLTGRREDTRGVTQRWLDDQGFHGSLNMRPLGVKVPLSQLKSEFICNLLRDRTVTSVVLFDDDPEVIRVVTAQCGEGYAQHCTWYQKPKAMVREATA